MKDKKTEVEKVNYSIDEISQAYGLSKSFLYKRSALGEFPMEKVGSRVLVPKVEFEAWLKKHRVEGGAVK